MTPMILIQEDGWLHMSSLVCPSCSTLCSDCSKEGTIEDDHYDKRENLDSCFKVAEQEDPENLLLGFLKEFGNGFSLG